MYQLDDFHLCMLLNHLIALFAYLHTAYLNVHLVTSAGFFSRDVVFWGGIAFVGRENVKNIQKTNEIRYCLGRREFKT